MTGGARRFGRDAGWALASLGLSALAHFVLRTFLAQSRGTDDLGLYTLVFVIYAFGMILAAFGMGAALTKYVAEHKDDVERTNVLVSSSVVVAPLFGLLFGLLVYFASSSIANALDMPDLKSLLQILSVVFPFIALEKAVLGYLNGLRRMRLFAFINIAQNTLTVVLTISLVSWGYGLTGAVVALVLPICLLSLFSLFSIRKSIVRSTLEQYIPAAKRLLAFGAYVVLVNGVAMIYTHTDILMLGYFKTETDVGLYSAALVIIMGLHIPPQAIQMITSPSIATYWGRDQIDRIEDLINSTMRYTAIFVIPLTFVLAFFGREILVLVFGQDFGPGTLALQVLLIGGMFASILISVGGALSSTKYVSMLFKLAIISLAINAILNLILIPPFGLTGAAAATATATVILVLLQLYFTQRLVKITIQWQWFAKLFTFTILLGLLTYGLSLVISHYICVPLALIIFLVALLKYFVTREDLTLVRETLWPQDEATLPKE